MKESGTVRAAPAAEPACPACEYARSRAWSDPGADYCAGVARALAATELGRVHFPFDFCRAHRAIVREASQHTRRSGNNTP
jgi:hypothetical protein